MQKISAKDLANLKRVEERGVYVDWDALSRKFNFTVCARISYDIDASVFQRLAELVTKAVDESDFACELQGIVFFPLILKGDVSRRADFKSHKRSYRSYFVGRNIDHKIWKKARTKRRVSLAGQNLQFSVLDIPDHHLSPPSKLTLLAMIEYAASKSR